MQGYVIGGQAHGIPQEGTAGVRSNTVDHAEAASPRRRGYGCLDGDDHGHEGHWKGIPWTAEGHSRRVSTGLRPSPHGQADARDTR